MYIFYIFSMLSVCVCIHIVYAQYGEVFSTNYIYYLCVCMQHLLSTIVAVLLQCSIYIIL
jgi:hypothetical protein